MYVLQSKFGKILCLGLELIFTENIFLSFKIYCLCCSIFLSTLLMVSLLKKFLETLFHAKLQLMTPQCGRSVVQVLFVRVKIGVVTLKGMKPQCVRSVVHVMVVRVDIGVVIYEAVTPQCGRSVVQVLVVRVDIAVVIYEAMTTQCGRLVVQVLVPILDNEW